MNNLRELIAIDSKPAPSKRVQSEVDGRRFADINRERDQSAQRTRNSVFAPVTVAARRPAPQPPINGRSAVSTDRRTVDRLDAVAKHSFDRSTVLNRLIELRFGFTLFSFSSKPGQQTESRSDKTINFTIARYVFE